MVSTACKLVLPQVSLNLNLFPHHQRGDSRKGGKENLPSLFSLAIGHFVVVVLISCLAERTETANTRRCSFCFTKDRFGQLQLFKISLGPIPLVPTWTTRAVGQKFPYSRWR